MQFKRLDVQEADIEGARIRELPKKIRADLSTGPNCLKLPGFYW